MCYYVTLNIKLFVLDLGGQLVKLGEKHPRAPRQTFAPRGLG
jgi:hypothetical protein